MRPSLLLLLVILLPSAASAQVTGEEVPCTDGFARDFGCRNVDLLSFLPIDALGGDSFTNLNDIWGWTDPETGREYALVGRTDGTAIVDVTTPTDPIYLGYLPTHTSASLWRDVKVYDNTLLVVAEAPEHGLQLFDLTRVRDVGGAPVVFDDYTHYDGFGSAHNIAVNQTTGYAYAVGTRTCGGGMHMIDVVNPSVPAFAGCFTEPFTGRAGTGYTHDAQCVVYNGPDEDYAGREICFAYNETAVVIADVTDKSAPLTLGVATYPTSHYVHQGWLTEDQRFVYQDDELDETRAGLEHTRTLIWDVADLDDPVLVTEYFGVSTSIDHNQYLTGNRAFQANYTSGLRILDVSNPALPVEVGFFDTFPANDLARQPGGSGGLFEGAWSNYPFFESGIVVISSIQEGLFVVRPTGIAARTVADEDEVVPSAFALSAAYPNPFNPSTRFTLTVDAAGPVRLAVYDVLGREVARLHDGPLPAGAHSFTWTADETPSGSYLIRAHGAGGTATTFVTLAK